MLTDGVENVKPNVSLVRPEILAKGIVVDTISLSQNADPILISLSTDTGMNFSVEVSQNYFCGEINLFQ